MKYQTQDYIDNNELGFTNMPIRFFVYDEDEETGELDIYEVNEAAFLDAEGIIEYERHTTHQNGCKQICLTKIPSAY